MLFSARSTAHLDDPRVRVLKRYLSQRPVSKARLDGPYERVVRTGLEYVLCDQITTVVYVH